MTMTIIDLSFIIPAYNEEDNIEDTLLSIINHTPDQYSYEIIVIDHQSSDHTRSIALKHSQKVITTPANSVAQLRNIGADISIGNILIFIDADVVLTNDWHDELPNTIKFLKQNPLCITGSWCDIPANASILERYWFTPPREKNPRHLGTGHLIILSSTFTRINGFNETLKTGEDYDLCNRAIRIGGEIIDNYKLRVIHTDYPKNIQSFILREAWHGISDFSSINRILNSKVALLTLIFICLHIALITSIFLDSGISILMILIPIYLLCLTSSTIKYYRTGTNRVLVNSFLYYFYFFGRSVSFFKTVPILINNTFFSHNER